MFHMLLWCTDSIFDLSMLQTLKKELILFAEQIFSTVENLQSQLFLSSLRSTSAALVDLLCNQTMKEKSGLVEQRYF